VASAARGDAPPRTDATSPARGDPAAAASPVARGEVERTDAASAARGDAPPRTDAASLARGDTERTDAASPLPPPAAARGDPPARPLRCDLDSSASNRSSAYPCSLPAADPPLPPPAGPPRGLPRTDRGEPLTLPAAPTVRGDASRGDPRCAVGLPPPPSPGGASSGGGPPSYDVTVTRAPALPSTAARGEAPRGELSTDMPAARPKRAQGRSWAQLSCRLRRRDRQPARRTEWNRAVPDHGEKRPLASRFAISTRGASWPSRTRSLPRHRRHVRQAAAVRPQTSQSRTSLGAL
jgi:hypothetical protein